MNVPIIIPDDTIVIDRRKRKTQAAIETALIDLLHEKPLENISISELAERADVNRKTFYNNYASVEDVLRGIEHKISRYLQSKIPAYITIENEIEIFNILLETAENMEPYKELLYRVTDNRGSVIIMESLQNILLPFIQQSFDKYRVDKALTGYISRYITNGLSILFFEWFRQDNLSARQIAQLAYNMTISAIHLENYNHIL